MKKVIIFFILEHIFILLCFVFLYVENSIYKSITPASSYIFTAQEEKELVKKAIYGDEQAKNLLVRIYKYSDEDKIIANFWNNLHIKNG